MWNNSPPTVPALIPGICDYGTFRGKRDFADGIKLRIWRCEIIPGYPGGSNVITSHLVRVREGDVMTETEIRERQRERSRGGGDAMLLALQMEKGPLAKERGHH